MKKISTLLMTMFALSTINFAQNGRYDVWLEQNDCDCCNEQIIADIHIRASSPDSTFRIGDQSYLFSFNPDVIDSVRIVDEGEISGFLVPGNGNLGFSLYAGHTLTVSSNEITYNVDFQGGDGLLIETQWVQVGTIAFNITDFNAPLGVNWLMQSDASPTIINGVTDNGAVVVSEGMYINDVPNTFGDCACFLGYGAVYLSNQSEVNNFATDYPGPSAVNLIIDGASIVDLTPLSVIDYHVNRLTISNSNVLNSLAGLENIPSIGCRLVITDNPQLSICNIPAVCSYLENGGEATISNNAGGCNNETEAIQDCFLPVEMSTPLQARLQNQTAILTWRTETETNNTGFEIQKSRDGIQWERIGWQAGQGSTYTPHAYTYIDENPFSNTSYYRLKQVDFDGNSAYSNIATLEYNRPTVNIFPNPVKDKLYINTDEQTIDNVLIFDTMGRQINAQLTGNIIDVSSLAEGLYTIKVIINDEYFYEKIVVE